MRGYIFTEHEREMLRKYIHQNEKSYGFDQLRKRIKDNYSTLREDIDLIEKVREKWEKV